MIHVLVLVLVVLGLAGLHLAGPAADATAFLRVNSGRLSPPAEWGLRLTSHLGLFPTNVLVWLGVTAVRQAAGIVGGAGMAATWLTCRIVKALSGRPRPHLVVDGARLVGLRPSGSSFPSSHAALAFYSAATLADIFEWGAAAVIGAYAVATVVALVRIYLGAHYPRDVLAGAAIGLSWSLLTQAGLARLPDYG